MGVLYDFDGVKTFIQDSVDGLVAQGQLVKSSKQIFEEKFKDLTLWETGLIVNNEGGFARAIERLKVTPKGSFRSAMGRHDTNGIISLDGQSELIKIDVRDAESSYSIYDEKATQVNLLTGLMKAHNEVFVDDLDKIGYLGDDILGNKGLLNIDYSSSFAGGKTWEAMTDKELTDALRELYITQTVAVGVKSLYATHIIVPVGVYLKISVNDYKDGVDLTIRRKMERDLGVKFVPTYRAVGVKDFGCDVAVAMSNDQYAQQFRLPQPLKFTPLFRENYKRRVTSYYGVGGVDFINDCGARLEFK